VDREDLDRLLCRWLGHAQPVAVLANGAVDRQPLVPRRIGCARNDHGQHVEKGTLHRPGCLGEFGVGGRAAKEALDVGNEKDAIARLLSCAVHRLLGIDQERMFRDGHEIAEIDWPFALGHQQCETLDERAPAHTCITHEHDMPMIRQRQKTQQIVHQLLANVHRRSVATLGPGNLILARGPLRLRVVGKLRGQRIAGYSVAPEDARCAHAALGESAQRVLRPHLALTCRVCDTAPLVKHDQHFGGQPDRAVFALVHKIGIYAWCGARERFGRCCKLVQPEASLSSQARQQAVRRAARLLDESQQQHSRGQKRAPRRTHARRCSIKRSRQFGRWDVWIKRAQSAASSI